MGQQSGEKERTMSKWVVHCKKSKFDTYIGRPSEWGNKYEVGKDGTRKEVIEKHKADVLADPEMVEKIKRELKGQILGCWCKTEKEPNRPCHGDILATIANNETIGEMDKEVDVWEEI